MFYPILQLCQNFWLKSTNIDIKPHLRTVLTIGSGIPIEFIDR